MRCAYLTLQPAENDENAWSGLNYNIRRAISRSGFDLEHLGSLGGKTPLSVRMKCWYYKYAAKQGFDPSRDPAFLRQTGQFTQLRIEEKGPFDFLLAPSSYPVYGVKTNLPKFVWTDATFAGMIDYYPDFKGLSPATLKAGVETEIEALRECAGVFYASEWAAESAIKDYQLPRERVHVVPFGANVTSPFKAAEEAVVAIQQRQMPPCEFLFMGVQWERKGGALAVEVVRSLNALGIPARLTVVGCQPSLPEADLKFTRVIGFLDKTKPDQEAELRGLLRQSHFFIMPTQAEAFGLVFAEAAAFAVPSLALQTGGVTTAVQDGRTGLLFQRGDSATDWARKIAELLQDPARYAGMAAAAYGYYAQTLNWEAAGAHARRVILENLPAPGR